MKMSKDVEGICHGEVTKKKEKEEGIDSMTGKKYSHFQMS